MARARLEEGVGEINIVEHLDDDLPKVQVDAEQMRQVFLNIVFNALTAAGKGTVDVQSRMDGGEVAVAVGAVVEFTSGALRAMSEYVWPGNVRELENFCERVILMRSGDKIGEKAVPRQMESLVESAKETSSRASTATLPEIERQAIADSLEAAEWNRSLAALNLGIPRHVLLYRLKKFDISPPDDRKD